MRHGTGMKVLAHGMRWLMVTSVTLLAGCSNFFPPNTHPVGGGGGGGGATAGDYVYVVNNQTNSLSGFGVGPAALTLLAGSPYTLTTGLAPLSVAVTRANTFVYVGGFQGIVCYSIGTGGVLTLAAQGGVTQTANFVSLETSPDGQWLLGLDAVSSTLYVYGIVPTTGALTRIAAQSYAVPGNGASVPTQVHISPNGTLVAAALGTGGDVFFTFNTATGVLTNAGGVRLSSGSDSAVIFDSTSAYAFVGHTGVTAGTSGVATYSVSNTGVVAGVGSLVVSGTAPYSLVLDSTGGFLYAANRGDGTISGYSVTGGTLLQLTGSPYVSSNAVTALALDNAGTNVVAVASVGPPDVTLYGFDALATGRLGAVTKAASGTAPAGAVAEATTH